jgi:hypothetical protein
MKQAFAGLNSQLGPTRTQVTALSGNMQTDVNAKLQDYFAQSQSAKTGFQKAIDLLGKLTRQYQTDKNIINSL